MVFKQVNGKTIVAKRPTKTTRTPTADQLLVQEKFKNAAAYAKASIDDELRKERYGLKAGRGKSAYNVAFADYFNAPKLSDLDVSQYNGQAGNTITVRAIDDFEVQQVQVQILVNELVIESGLASIMPNGLDWQYIAQVANGTLIGAKIVVEANDLPGNKTYLSVTLG